MRFGPLALAAAVSACVLTACAPRDATRAQLPRSDAVATRAAIAVGQPLPVIPRPRTVVRLRGSFALPASFAIEANGAATRNAADFLRSELRRLGIEARVVALGTPLPAIRIREGARVRRLGNEGYRLDVDASGVSISAGTGAGLFYGVQTLAQLASTDGRHVNALPYVRIVDWPEYRWRGVHLDVSRHFFPVSVVERYIDLAARFKLNTFHWHLTDDQGWRIEIRAYPRLTAVGGCRDGTQVGGFGSTVSDGRRTCAFYSQRDIRAVVAYAKARYVTVVPEIEGPGHSVEALAAYPWLACHPGSFATLQLWGSSPYNICPTERSFAFYDGVVRELAQLFPGRLVHIGGDEASQAAYFTQRIEAIARRYGRRIVGWDEILGAGVSRDAIVMAWHPRAVLPTVGSGNDVVMAPDPPLYFDAYQGDPQYEPTAFPGPLTTLETVYAYDPIRANLTSAQHAHLLGAQGNLWTEYVPDATQLWYMAYPREIALAELCWTPRARMQWNDFTVRLGPALQRLEMERITFRVPEVRYRTRTSAGTAATRSRAVVELRALVPGATIRYTTDGTVPTPASPTYVHPFRVSRIVARRIAAVAVLADGRVSTPSFFTISKI